MGIAYCVAYTYTIFVYVAVQFMIRLEFIYLVIQNSKKKLWKTIKLNIFYRRQEM